MTNEEIKNNIATLKEEVKRTLKEVGRENDDIVIVGACKTMPKEITDYVRETSLLDALGDNKVQELLDKYEEGIPWHFIGNLQSNKVKYIIDKVTLIHSLDRLSLAKEIDKEARKHSLVQDCLIEINIAGEESKGGVSKDAVTEFANAVKNFSGIKIKGMMSVLPNISDSESLCKYLEEFNTIFDSLREVFGEEFTIRSVGMTNDYKIALKYGANMIRIGRSIFGDRRQI